MVSQSLPRRVLLLELTWTRDKDPRLPLGHASLLAALHGSDRFSVCSLVYPVNRPGFGVGSLVDEIMSFVGDRDHESVDLAIGVYVWGESLVQQLMSTLRLDGFKGRIILGGPQISYAAPGTLERAYPNADLFVRGYGEWVLPLLVKSRQPLPLKGVHIAGTEDRGEQAEVDLEALPSPWLTGLIPLGEQQFIRWETQRGCPFRCAFCQHKEAGARLRRRTLQRKRIFDEIELFCKSGVKDIAVLDPIFNIGAQASEILEAFVYHQYEGRLSLQCRAENIDDEFLAAAARLDVVLEFGLQTIHDIEGRAINRRNHMKKVDVALAKVRERGIHHEVSLIFGLPEQTLESFLASVSWCLERRVPVIKAFPLMLLRGTELEQQQERWELEEEGDVMPVVVSSRSFSRSDWDEMASVSEALNHTEKAHPQSVDELMLVAKKLPIQMKRWQP